MAKLVLGRPRKETLQEAYNNFQQIEHNFKTNKGSDKARPFKNTNYTIKELKKINEEAKKSFNVFRKYVLVIDLLPDKKANQEAQGKSLEICIDQLQRNVINDEDFDKFTSVKNRYEFRTLTTPI